MSTGSLVSKFTPCGFCSQVFQRKQDFYEHNNNEHADIVCEIWEGCPKCHKYYPNRLALNKHKLRHQQNRHKAAPGIHHDDLGGPEKCEFCQRTFGKKAQYYTHVNKVHVDVICKSWTKCEKCQKFFPSKRIRDRHLNGFKKRGESCSPKYNQDFGDHLDGILVDSDNFGVEEDSGLGGPHFLATHCKVARSSLAIKSSSCVFCGLELYRREDLFEHVNNEHKEEISNSWLPCNDCQKFFPTRTALITHAATHDIDNFKEDIDILENSNGSLTCTFCKLVLTRKQDLYEHANKEHLSDIALIWKKCKDCDRHYPTRKALNNHEDSHRRRVASGDDDVLGRGQSCEYCDQYFSRRDQYYKHVNEDHKSEISSFWISCFDCHRYFPTKRVRDRHRERFRKRKESCIPKYALPQEDEEVDESQIMAEFSTEDSVQKDSLLPPQPTDDHPFLTCPFCKLVLPRKQDYYDHANREHVDDIDLIWFGCKQCLRYYPTKKSLNNHEEKSHRRKGPGEEETILKAESCMFCNEQFARREQVYRHVNDEHLDKIKNSWKQCADCLKYFPTKRVHDRHRDKFRSRGELCIPKYANSSGEVRYKITHIPRNPDKPGLTCPFCMLIMQREQDFYDHANRKHYEEIESLWEKCFYCSKFYPTKKSLYKHKRICYKGPPDKSSSTNPAGSTKEVCEFCPETFTRKVLYYDHVDSVHKTEAEQKWVSCDTCFRYFPTKWVCDQHKLGFRERGESCGPGNQTSEFDVEEDVVEDDNYEYFDCDFCDMSFSIEEEYHSHAQQIHSSEVKKVWIGCASCQKYFPTPESYHLHLTECQADSKQKALKSPSVTISKLQPLKPELPPPPPLMPRPPSLFMQSQLMNLVQRQGRLNCTFCLQVFGKEQHYYRHVNDAHHDEASEVWATCDGCNKLFPTKDIMDRHKKKAQLRGMPCNPDGFKNCEICSMTFARKEAYYKHANDVHKDVICYTWVQCVECCRYYPSKAILNSHKLWYKSVNRTCKKILIGVEAASQEDASADSEKCSYCTATFPAGSGFLKHHEVKVHGISTIDDESSDGHLLIDELQEEMDWIDELDEDPDQFVFAKTEPNLKVENGGMDVETFEDSFMVDIKPTQPSNSPF